MENPPESCTISLNPEWKYQNYNRPCEHLFGRFEEFDEKSADCAVSNEFQFTRWTDKERRERQPNWSLLLN